jgi:anti-sigma regulatory factor (Ser/Thr protein kinase)
MQSQQVASSTNGRRPPSPDPFGDGSELKALRARSRRDVVVINTLREAVSNFHSAAKALKAENTELRADNERMRVQQLMRSQTNGRVDNADSVEVFVPADERAPRAARQVVTSHLGDLVAPSVLANAQLLISELVTNSVRHSGVAAGEPLTVRVDLGQTWCRVQVEDPGRDGVIAPRPADAVQGNGMGLDLVQLLSDRWGLERAPERGTWVWAQLSRAAAGAGAAFQPNGTRPSSAGDGLSHVP